MIKNKIILLIFSIFLFSFINANIIVSPQNSEVTVQVGTAQNFTFNIFNNFTFDIYDLKFPELQAKGFIFPNISILKNTSSTYTYTVKTNNSFYGVINSKIQFNFLVDLPEEIQTYSIQITENGFNPTYKTIRNGDTVRWTNLDNITHEIYSTQFGTLLISPNSSQSYTFNSLGSFNYKDLTYYIFHQFNGIIEVVNRTQPQKAHNPNYNGIWIVNLNSISEPTNITISNSQSSYEIEHSKSKKGLITITNVGTKTAERIKLTSDSEWISFNKNNFDLNSGDPSGVEYTILPFLFNTNQSNKTYTINIQIKAFNTEQKNVSISLFIPYKEITGDITNDVEWGVYLDSYYCPKYPCSSFCHPELPECSINSGSNNNNGSTIIANITSVDLYNTMKSLSGINDKLSRLENLQKAFEEKYGIKIEDAVNLGNSSFELGLENRKIEKSRNTTLIILAFCLVLAGCLVYIFIRVNKKSDRESRTADFHKYKT